MILIIIGIMIGVGIMTFINETAYQPPRGDVV